MLTQGERGTTFVKQAAILGAAGILSRVLGFILRIPLANVLGDEGIGIYGDGYAVYNFFLVLSSAGLPSAISKMTSERVAKGRRDEAYKILTSSMKCACVIGFASAVVLAFFAKPFAALINNPRSEYALLALAPTVFIVALMSVFRGYFQGLQSMEPTALSQLIEQIFNVIFSIAFMYLFMKMADKGLSALNADKTAMGAAGGQLGTGAGALAGFSFLLVFYMIFRNFIKAGASKDAKRAADMRLAPAKPDSKLLKELFAVAVPIIAGTAVFSFSNLIDSAMVKGRLLSAGFEPDRTIALFGIYSGKYIPITTLPVSITAALATAVLPSIAASAALGAKSDVRKKTNSALRVSMLVSIPAAIGLGALAEPIYALIFRNAREGHQLLTIGSLAVIFLSLSQIAAGVLQGAGKIRIPVIAAVCGVLVKITLNYILCAVPSINIYGAVISTIACYAVSGGINLYMTYKVTRADADIMSILVKPAGAALAMGFLVYTVYSLLSSFLGGGLAGAAIALIFAVCIGVAAYFFLLLLINGINEGDMRLFPMGRQLTDKLKKKGWL